MKSFDKTELAVRKVLTKQKPPVSGGNYRAIN
jgi:hypothetical protein